MSKQNCVKWDKKAKDDDFICKKKNVHIFLLGTTVILNMQWDFLSPVQV